MGTEEQISKLADSLKDQIVSDAATVIKDMTAEDTEFFADLAKRYAKAYFKKKTGDADDQASAERSIEALDIAMGSKVAERGLDFIEHGQDMLMSILKTVGKTVLTLALA